MPERYQLSQKVNSLARVLITPVCHTHPATLGFYRDREESEPTNSSKTDTSDNHYTRFREEGEPVISDVRDTSDNHYTRSREESEPAISGMTDTSDNHYTRPREEGEPVISDMTDTSDNHYTRPREESEPAISGVTDDISAIIWTWDVGGNAIPFVCLGCWSYISVCVHIDTASYIRVSLRCCAKSKQRWVQ